jgi:hypothetical protein
MTHLLHLIRSWVNLPATHNMRRNNTQHNDIQHNDTQHNETQHKEFVCDT